MSPAEVESLVRGTYDAYNERDLDRAAGAFAELLELRNVATGEVLTGRNGYLQHAKRWIAAFPDSSLAVSELDIGADAATVQLISRGTHTGALLGSHGHIPPTWAQVEIPVCEVLRVRDGLIVKVDSYLDTGDLLRQMGLLPHSPLHAPDRRAPLELYALQPDASPGQQNKSLVQRFVARVMNGHDLEALSELCVPNVAWHGGPMGEMLDIAGYRRHLERLFGAFPNLTMETVEAVAEGDRVVMRTTLRGTHRGDFQGIPATGRHVTITGASTYRVVDGRIAEEWWHHDLFGILQQLDALPAAPTAARS